MDIVSLVHSHCSRAEWLKIVNYIFHKSAGMRSSAPDSRVVCSGVPLSQRGSYITCETRVMPDRFQSARRQRKQSRWKPSLPSVCDEVSPRPVRKSQGNQCFCREVNLGKRMRTHPSHRGEGSGWSSALWAAYTCCFHNTFIFNF